MAVEDDEWRIDEAPDALIVPGRWFDLGYRAGLALLLRPDRADPGARAGLRAAGDQFATALVRGPARGPGAGSAGSRARSSPRDSTLDLSVPVVARRARRGRPPGRRQRPRPETIELMTVAARLDPAPGARDRAGAGQRGRHPDHDRRARAPTRVDVGQAYDPSGRLLGAGPLRAARRPAGDARSAAARSASAGPFGTGRLGLRAFAVNLPGTEVAGVTARRERRCCSRRWTPPRARGRPTAGRPARPTCCTPAWDHADRLWVVDRTAAGAQVS